MATALADVVAAIAENGFVRPPAEQTEIDDSAKRGMPGPLLELYRLANGLYVVDGDDFPSPSGRWYRFCVPPLNQARTVAEFGFAPDDSPLLSRLENWWQFFDYGDSNWVGITDAEDGFRIVDLFHESVGQPESHAIIASSVSDFLSRVVTSKRVFWLGEDFETLDVI